MLLPVEGQQGGIALDVRGLQFLLDLGQADLLQSLDLANQRYQTVLSALETRNKLHEEFQLRVEAAAERVGAGALSVEDLEKEVGMRLSVRMRAATDNLYRAYNDALGSNLDVFEQLRGYGSTRFPNAKLLQLRDVPSTDGTIPAPPHDAA